MIASSLLVPLVSPAFGSSVAKPPYIVLSRTMVSVKSPLKGR